MVSFTQSLSNGRGGGADNCNVGTRVFGSVCWLFALTSSVCIFASRRVVYVCNVMLRIVEDVWVIGKSFI